MSDYKQEFLDSYFKDEALTLQETMGFYWAMKSRDFIPFIARIFKKHIYVLQEPNKSGIFPNPKNDKTVTCFHQFQDWIDVASTKASISMYNVYLARTNKPSKEYSTKDIIEKNYQLINGGEQFSNWSRKTREEYIRECLWNFDDESEAFGYASKEFAGQLLHKLILEAGINVYESEDFDLSNDIEWDWTVKDIWKLLDKLEEYNKGLPIRNEEAPMQSEAGLDLISSAMGADDFLWFLVDYLLQKK